MAKAKKHQPRVRFPWTPPAWYPAKKLITHAVLIDGIGLGTCRCPSCGVFADMIEFMQPDGATLTITQGALCARCFGRREWIPQWRQMKRRYRLISPKLVLRRPDNGNPLLVFHKTARRYVRADYEPMRSMTYMGTGEFRFEPLRDRSGKINEQGQVVESY